MEALDVKHKVMVIWPYFIRIVNEQLIIICFSDYLIMVIGGDDSFGSLDDVELLAIDSGFKTARNCPMQISPLPEPISRAAGALDYSGMICFFDYVFYKSRSEQSTNFQKGVSHLFVVAPMLQ